MGQRADARAQARPAEVQDRGAEGQGQAAGRTDAGTGRRRLERAAARVLVKERSLGTLLTLESGAPRP